MSIKRSHVGLLKYHLLKMVYTCARFQDMWNKCSAITNESTYCEI